MNKHLYTILLVAATALLSLTGCGFLDVAPDGVATEKDALSNAKAAERYLYTLYGYMPRSSSTTGAIDFLTGDEVVTPFEHETFANFPKGQYTANNPVISYWNDIFSGIRYCYSFIAALPDTPGLKEEVKTDYLAQAKFLVAYYHYLLIQSYGPIILIEGVEDTNASAESFKARVPFDQGVDFVVRLLDEAATDLPATRNGAQYGLATSVAAKALKAKLLVIAASPLFNGNAAFYSGFANHDGTQLMPLEYSAEKWTRALDACREAVSFALSNGAALYTMAPTDMASYPEPQNLIQRQLRMNLLDKDDVSELLFADTRGQSGYDIQSKSLPYSEWGKAPWAFGGVAPTLAMMKRFYTENGLPLDEDPSFPAESDWWKLMEVPDGYENAEGRIPLFLYRREPRLYSWVTFENGYYEAQGAGSVSDESSQWHRKYARGIKGSKLVMKMLVGEPSGRGEDKNNLRNNDYSPTGFLNKRYVPINHGIKASANINYIHPIITLADLYLLTAEAAVETGDLALAKSCLDKVRTRAGIPMVDAAWAGARHPEKAQSRDGMREIVRQERMIELYLMNQNFWDMRRWLLAEKYFDVKPMGMKTDEDRLEAWTRPAEVNVDRKFASPRNYLMPLPQGEIDKNKNLVQNPGY